MDSLNVQNTIEPLPMPELENLRIQNPQNFAIFSVPSGNLMQLTQLGLA